MNPRQRRGTLFMVIAVLGAIGVFFAVVSYVDDVESQVGERTPAFVVTKDVEAFHEIPADAVERVDIPKRWVSTEAISDLNDLTGRVAAAKLTAGTQLQDSNLVPKPSLEPGQREIAIMVDAETGVAGKVRSGDRVDVWATFDESITGVGPRTKVIAQDVLVINVGGVRETEKASSTGMRTTNEAVPITFATAEGQIKALTFAEAFASQTRLVLRPPTDESQVAPENKTYAETFPNSTGTDQAPAAGASGSKGAQ